MRICKAKYEGESMVELQWIPATAEQLAKKPETTRYPVMVEATEEQLAKNPSQKRVQATKPAGYKKGSIYMFVIKSEQGGGVSIKPINQKMPVLKFDNVMELFDVFPSINSTNFEG